MRLSNMPFGVSIVAAAFAAQALALGLGAGIYPVFMAYIESAYSINRAQASLGLPLIFIVGALVSPLIGARVDRGSPKTIMSAGALCMGAGLALLSQVQSLALFVFIWAILVGAGQAMLGTIPATSVVSNWFLARRSTMVAVAATGITVGMAIAPLLAEWLIEMLGWRQALFGLGIICTGLGVPVVLLGIVKRPQDVGLAVDGAVNASDPTSGDPVSGAADAGADESTPIFGDKRFWLMAATFATLAGLSLAFTTHVVSWAGESGFERRFAVMLLSVAAISAAIGKLSFGFLCDLIGLRKSLLTGVGAQVLGWSLMLMAPHPLVFAAGTMCFAFGTGCIVPLQAATISHIWGGANFGRVMGCTGLVAIISILLAPTVLGIAYEATGGYDLPMLAVLPVLFVPGLLFMALQLDAEDSPMAVTPAEPS